ncbi:MAG: hemerythrin domain-containing protein [Candidatus Binataceae bacterium]
MNPEFELEVPDLAAAGQRERIHSAFDRLVPGQTLELVLSVPAQAPGLLAEFQDRSGQGFDWWPLGNRAGAFRVLIAKRTVEPRTISGFLGTDHHRLTLYWDEFVEAVKTCELSHETLFTTEKGYRVAVVDRLSQFIFGLRRHIRMEEDHFFPLFEDRSRIPAGSGPTAVMRAEHQEIEATLRAVEKLFDAHDCAAVIQTIEGQRAHPSSLFRSHDAKEENVLYPMADRLFTQEEKDDLCLKMQTV